MNNPENPMLPERFQPGQSIEREAVMTQIGRKLYDQCVRYTELFETYQLVPLKKDELDTMYKADALKDFSMSPGLHTGYMNRQGHALIICRREGHDGVVQLEDYNPVRVDNPYEAKGDYVDTYLIDQDGRMLAAEHMEIIGDNLEREITPLQLDAEAFLHKIDTEFRAAPQQPQSEESALVDEPPVIE